MFDYLNTVVDTIGHSFLTADLDVRHSTTAMLAIPHAQLQLDHVQLPSKLW